jgi:ABC-type antimicrobial peptide transport system permease subunit
MALMLAAVGLYGVLAHSVSLRGREFGTRLALGADPSALVRSGVREGLVLCGLGVLAGGGVVALTATGLERWLPSGSGVAVGWGVAAAFGLMATALLSSLVPALRASRTDPAETLREGG